MLEKCHFGRLSPREGYPFLNEVEFYVLRGKPGLEHTLALLNGKEYYKVGVVEKRLPEREVQYMLPLQGRIRELLTKSPGYEERSLILRLHGTEETNEIGFFIDKSGRVMEQCWSGLGYVGQSVRIEEQHTLREVGTVMLARLGNFDEKKRKLLAEGKLKPKGPKRI